MIRSLFGSRQWWTYFFIIVAVLIIIATVYFSNSLSKQLAEEERAKTEVWAEGMRIFSIPDPFEDPNESTLSIKELKEKQEETQIILMNLILEINTRFQSIPVMLYDEANDFTILYNMSSKDSIAILENKNKAKEFMAKNPPILMDGDGTTYYMYYDDSDLLKRLIMFPYVQLSVVIIFILLSFLALLSVKKAEQNKVWVGLSKETAHQLGTPISSLIAWVEYLKTKEVDTAYLKEMEKDVKRLETIADRFSKIGSNPDLLPLNINDAIKSSCEYMSNRISSKVKLNIESSKEPTLVLMNESLFSWVIENLTKNAVDAMEGQGAIDYSIINSTKKVYIDITDTGKGISKSRFKTIFNPGYTTKTRGWGLGLSLVRRIIESYPGGKIYVKSSELGKGTTFRIELRKYSVN